jgi:hypothetical protein
MSDGAVSGGGSIISKVTLAVARVASRNRSSGDYNNFTVSLTPQVSRAVGVVVKSVVLYNDWYTIDESHNTTYWSKAGILSGDVQTVRIQPGYYDGREYDASTGALTYLSPGKQVANALNVALDAVFGAGEIVVKYKPRGTAAFVAGQALQANVLTFESSDTNDVTYWERSGGSLGTGTLSTMDRIVGFSDGQVATDTTPILATDECVPNFYDPPYVDLQSYQIRQPISIDTRTGGGGNTFLHLDVSKTPKLGAVTFEIDAATDYSVIKFPAPTDFQQLNIFTTNPDTGEKMDMGQNVEIVFNFLCVQ